MSEEIVWKALSNQSRRGILERLANGPATTGELCDYLEPLDRCTVIKHLSQLEKAGLIVVTREGRQRWNRLDTKAVETTVSSWVSKLVSTRSASLKRLKTLAEETSHE